ncbi:MAG: DNA polymerase IV [Eubacterium sp.]|nr:DNA polymerase IV [Eubacterium sp.]
MSLDRKIIFHIDVNSAFLSWSAIRLLESGSDVDLRKIPSIVGGDLETRHGIVVAKSIPAKKYGIHTADTVASALKKCPGLVSVRPDHTYYRDKSRKLMEYLKGICPRIQQVSVDECYMDFEPVRDRYRSPESAARNICDGVRDTFGFTVNIGISDRKVLAKMASDFEKPDRVHTLYASEIQDKLWPLPIAALHMCGKSSAERFEQLGILTIGDLAASEREWIKSIFKSHGDLLWRYANGIDDSEVDTEDREVKSVGNSTTLSEDARTRERAISVLSGLAGSVSDRLRKHSLRAGMVCVEIKYATFKTVSRQTTLPRQVDRQEDILATACTLFDELWDGAPIRLLGIRTGHLTSVDEPFQMDIFSYQDQLAKEQVEKKRLKKLDKEKRLAEALGKIETKYGPGKIHKGTKETGDGSLSP